MADEGTLTRRELESLKDLLLRLRDADRELVGVTLAAAKEAVGVANTANDKRLELLNEFRVEQSTRDSTFLRTDLYHQYHETLEARMEVSNHTLMAKIDSLTGRVSQLEGRLMGTVTVGAFIAIISALYELLK